MTPETNLTPLASILEWDSRFFGKTIAWVTGPRLDPALASQIDAWAQANRVDCLYFLAAVDDPQTARAAEDAGYHLTDIRVTLEHRLAGPFTPPGQYPQIRPAHPADIDALRAISRNNHRDSRFYYDGGFDREKCDELYAIWIEKSVRGSADQVLVGTNRTRRRYNHRLRELKGFTAAYPQAGDKLVCLRNDPAKGLLNGSLWKVMTSSRETVKPGINLLVAPEEDDPDRGVAKIKLLKAAFEDPDADIPWQQKKRFDDFDYGYALTVHKAQGSQWDEVVLFDESFAFKDTRQRWLYTAITRAANRLTIVR